MIKWILILAVLALALKCLHAQEEQFLIRFHEEQMLRRHHFHEAPNANNITVHLIPHSHDDVGWLKTVDEYYYGDRQDIQWAAVQYVYDTMVAELTAHPNYKFVVVEMAFLYRWWKNAEENQRQSMKKLVALGQIQFINGGWCMSDQATVYYEDFIDQMTVGLRWLQQTFNYVPDIAWHIDPFGHQASAASMFSQMGMQAFFFARIDYQDKEKRMSQKNLEMIWKPHQTVSDSTNYIFTHVNYYLYAAPPGFNFDLKWLNEPIKDDRSLEDYNIDKRADDYVEYFKSMSLHYRSNTLMHCIGGDFQYANARQWFKNMDKLINYINSKPEYGVKFMYSTPGAYIKEIHSQSLTYQTKTDDFFPYADQQNAYWTGYFTSRVAFKGFVRDFSRWIQSVRKYIAECKMRGSSLIDSMQSEIEEGIWQLETSIGIMQHHDAVSGTEKQRVAEDYIATALRSIQKFKPIYQKIMKEQITKQTNENPVQDKIQFNIFWNQTAKQTGVSDLLSSNKTVMFALYNPGPAQERQLKISVPPHDLRVLNQKNQALSGDVFCVSTWDSNHCELVFKIALPESSNAYIKIYQDSKNATAKVSKLKELSLIQASKGFNLTSTAYLKVTKSTQKMDLTLGNITESFSIGYNYYESFQSDGQKSGAYIFRPASNDLKKFSTTKTIHYCEAVQGVYLSFEGDKTVNKIFFSKIPGYLESKGIQVESRIQSIPINDKIGKQVTINFQTAYNSDSTFYTDSNGLEEQARKINYRPTWDLIVNEQVAGNYYPVNSHIGFIDSSSKRKVTVLTDRSQGGTVLRTGEIQLMVHRRLLNDDVRGVNQPLNEPEPSDPSKGLIQNIRHYLVFGDNYRDVQVQNDQKIQISFSESSSNTFSKYDPGKVPFTVPNGVKLYIRPFVDNSYLLRLQSFNIQIASVSIPDGFSFTEYTLSANQVKDDWTKKQYKWNTQQEQITSEGILKRLYSKLQEIKTEASTFLKELSEDNGAIDLNFLQIRTFKVKQN